MRLLVASLLILALTAGCFGKDEPPAPVVTPTPTPTPQGVADVQGGQSSVPPEFAAGFEITAVDTGFKGAEPSIGITSKGNIFATALDDALVIPDVAAIPGQLVVKSADGGRTWAATNNPTKLPFTLDPMLWVDLVTDRIFTNHLYVGCSYMGWSDDEGETWTGNPASCGTPGIDHQKLATGPFVGTAAAFASNPLYSQAVTFCYNKLGGTFCAFSFDGGITFPIDTMVDSSPFAPSIDTQFGCGGINGNQKVGPDGTLFLPYGLNCNQAFVATSEDSGLTWTRHRLNQPQFEIDPCVTVTPDGMAYYMYRSGDQQVWMLRSKDRFNTVEGPFRISPPEVQGTVFTSCTSGSDGRVAFAFLGHTNPPKNPDEIPDSDSVPKDTRWTLYAVMTVDGEAAQPTFVSTHTSSLDPVQVGCVQENGCGQRNLLDFIDMRTAPDGRFFIAFADGCTTDKCRSPEGTDDDSRDRELTVARLSLGPSLWADQPAIVE